MPYTAAVFKYWFADLLSFFQLQTTDVS